jgi:hypothetical protein
MMKGFCIMISITGFSNPNTPKDYDMMTTVKHKWFVDLIN